MAQYYELLHPMVGCEKGQIFSIAKDSPWAHPLGRNHWHVTLDAELVRNSRYWFKEHQKEFEVIQIDKRSLSKLQELFLKLFPIK